MRQLGRRNLLSLGHANELVDVALFASRQRRQRLIRRERVFDVAQCEQVVFAVQDVAQVVDICAVRQHVRDLELVAGFRVRVTRHDHAELLAAHVVGARLARSTRPRCGAGRRTAK